tara:strand:- start:1758 stop:2585 length:828 start_codon:yes stop_codon:yes gene_type:complete
MDFDYYIDDSFQEDKDNTIDDVESSEDVSANNKDAATSDDKVESSDVGTEEPVSLDSNSEESISSDEEVVFPHLIGKKIGMTQLFLGQGNVVTATVLEMGPCFVTQIKKESREGYNSIQLSYGDISKSNKALTGHFSKFNQSPKKHLKEFRCSDRQLDFNLGEVLTIKQFELGDFVKVTGTSKGKGFTGHMKRHGFGGGRRSHGKNSVMRKAGSVGAGSDPSRVFPGMKMAGRKGNYKKTIKNLSVIKLDYENNLIFVTGSVPGANNGLVYLSKI